MADPLPFDWSLVQTFTAALEAGSLLAAARQLGTTQPTLSRRLAALERQLGAPLFERTGRGLVPTAAGAAIVEAARGMREHAARLALAVRGQREATTGTVRVTTSEVAATYLLPPVVAALRRDEPGIELELSASNQLENLLEHRADIAVRMVRPRQRSLMVRKLGEVPVVACAHRCYLERAGAVRRPADLAQHQLVGYDRDDTILRGFARLGVPLPRAAFSPRTDQQVVYCQLVAAGAGIGFLARYSLAHLPGVVEVLPLLPIPPLPCYLVAHRELRSRAVVRRVFDYLAAHLPARLAAGAELDSTRALATASPSGRSARTPTGGLGRGR